MLLTDEVNAGQSRRSRTTVGRGQTRGTTWAASARVGDGFTEATAARRVGAIAATGLKRQTRRLHRTNATATGTTARAVLTAADVGGWRGADAGLRITGARSLARTGGTRH